MHMTTACLPAHVSAQEGQPLVLGAVRKAEAALVAATAAGKRNKVKPLQ
jgi:hypothetical protein